MLYWSSLLREQETKELQAQVAALQRQITRLQVQPKVVVKQEVAQEGNLLEVDPFYEETLPRILGEGFEPHGTYREATMGKPDNLHPFAAWQNVRNALGMCHISVASLKTGFYEDFTQGAAYRMEREGNTFRVFLRSDLEWEPLNPAHFPASFELAEDFLQPHPVTAHDFKFSYDAIMNPFNQTAGAAAMRNYLRDIEEFRVVDDHTFEVTWHEDEGRIKYSAQRLTGGLSPLASWVWQRFPDGSKIVDGDDYRNDSVWAQNFAEHWAKNVIVSCGPWIFDGWDDELLALRRNPNFYNPHAALFERYTTHFRPGPDLVWQDFKSGQIDTFDSRGAPEKLIELEEFMKSDLYKGQIPIGRLEYVDRAYRYIGWNQKRPLFESKEVRQALTMAIDRERIINQALHGMGIETTGNFFPNDPAYDPLIQAWPFDPVAARRLLEQEGWIDRDGDGVRDKDGVSFRFKLLYPATGGTAQRLIADYVSTALREVGVDCQPLGADIADLSAAYEGKDFDAILLGWALPPPPSDPRQIWHSDGAEEKGSSNAIGFSHPEADGIIEGLQYEEDRGKRKELYHRFHAILHEEQPYTFLYVPRRVLLYREDLGNVFIPAERQDLVPGAVATEPIGSIFYRKNG